MNTYSRLWRLCVTILVGLALVPRPADAIIVRLDISDIDLTPKFCTGPTPGKTWLLDPLVSSPTGDPCLTAAVKAQFPNWGGKDAEYNWGATLKGELSLEMEAVHVCVDPNCFHGASAQFIYAPKRDDPDPTKNDPCHVAWMQFFTETGGSGNRTNCVDPPANSSIRGVLQDDKPFYWGTADGTENIEDPDLRDNPSDDHLEKNPWSGGVSFCTILTSWDADDHKITLHDEIFWGYKGYCIPEPATVLLLGLSGLALLRRRRKA